MKTNWPRLLITFVAVCVLKPVCNVLVHALWLAPTYASLAKVWRPDAQSKGWIILPGHDSSRPKDRELGSGFCYRL